jgi:hypothetical protein
MSVEKNLKIVAWLFIASGVFSVVAGLASGRLVIGTGLLAVPAGIGLLDRKPGWRAYALWLLLAELIGTPVLFVLALKSSTLRIELPHQYFKTSSPLATAGVLTPFYLLAAWQFYILQMRATKRLFENSESPSQ